MTSDPPDDLPADETTDAHDADEHDPTKVRGDEDGATQPTHELPEPPEDLAVTQELNVRDLQDHLSHDAHDLPHDIPPDPGSADSASPRMQSIVESLLFAADKPLSVNQLGELLGESELERVRAAVAAVERSSQTRGIQLHGVAGGYQFRTNPQNAVWVQKLLMQKPVRLSRQLLETLAIVSYRQPITRPEIDEIRGVDSGGTLKTLMERQLVRILGKKEEPGRPMLYGTTREFLEFFNLKDLKDLPTLREFHELSEEHQAQVAALEGVAPEGTIEKPEEAAAHPDGPEPPALTRLEVGPPPEDEAELAEIDQLIRSANVTFASDSDQATTNDFDGDSAPTISRTDRRPLPLTGEFDNSEATGKRPRPGEAHEEGADEDETTDEKKA